MASVGFKGLCGFAFVSVLSYFSIISFHPFMKRYGYNKQNDAIKGGGGGGLMQPSRKQCINGT